MKKPNWSEPNDDQCQWPRCRQEGTVHYSHGATKWIDPPEGVELCDAHQKQMSEALFPDPVGPEVGAKLWLKATEDYPREEVEVLDWWYDGEVIVQTADGEVPFSEFEDAVA